MGERISLFICGFCYVIDGLCLIVTLGHYNPYLTAKWKLESKLCSRLEKWGSK